MPQGQKEPKHKKQKQYCNKFNEDFKKVFHIKKKDKKKNNRMYLTKFCKKYYNIERTLSLLFILLRGMFLDLIFLEQF